jgi:hypothetical protein
VSPDCKQWPAVNIKVGAIAIAVQKEFLGPTIPTTERAISSEANCAPPTNPCTPLSSQVWQQNAMAVIAKTR